MPVRSLTLSIPLPGNANAARAMERAMARVDADGIFGHGAKRDQIVLNVEVMPPDATNVARARRLNPLSAITDWLVEAAEPSTM